MPKNIVIFSDGTGQEGGEGYNTNVYKLFNMIEDRTERQIAFYDPGLGTGFVKYTSYVTGWGPWTSSPRRSEAIPPKIPQSQPPDRHNPQNPYTFRQTQLPQRTRLWQLRNR